MGNFAGTKGEIGYFPLGIENDIEGLKFVLCQGYGGRQPQSKSYGRQSPPSPRLRRAEHAVNSLLHALCY